MTMIRTSGIPVSTLPHFHVPTKPYSVIDAINRVHVATGSIGMAMAASGADYNGHRSNLTFNDYRQYYVGEFYWGQRCVFHRGTVFAIALNAALAEFDRQGLGASLHVYPKDEADIAICRANPRLVEGDEDLDKAAWYTWQHKHAAWYVRDEKTFGGIPASFLLNASSVEDYQAKVTALIQSRRVKGTLVVKDLVNLGD